jgi:hypothetical protein
MKHINNHRQLSALRNSGGHLGVAQNRILISTLPEGVGTNVDAAKIDTVNQSLTRRSDRLVTMWSFPLTFSVPYAFVTYFSLHRASHLVYQGPIQE